MSEQHETIVVAAGDAAVAKSIERLLNASGFHAHIFGSIEELFESEAARATSCLILDVHLPDLPAFQLKKQLFEKRIVAPFVLISAYDDPELRVAAPHAGAVAYLTIPFRASALLAAINKARWFGPSCGSSFPVMRFLNASSLCCTE